MNTNYSNRIASKLAKFSGVDLVTVQSLFADPKANKNVIKQIFTQSQKIAVAVSKKYRQMSKDSNAQLETLRKQSNTKVQFAAAVKAAKQALQDAKNQDPFTLLGISKPNIDFQTPNAITNTSQPQYYGNGNGCDWDDCGCKKKCKCEKKYYEKTGQLIKELLPCAPHIPIPGGYQPLPFVCSQPGTYCLTSNLIYTGTDFAITIASSNVKINLDGFKITLMGFGATGIDIENYESIEVYGGQIEGTDTSGVTNEQTGINIYNAVNVNIHDMIMTDLFNPIHSMMSVNCQYAKLYMSRPAPDLLVRYLDFGAISMYGCVNQVARNVKTNEYSGNYYNLSTIFVHACIDTTIDDVQCYKSDIVNGDEELAGIDSSVSDLINIKNIQLKNFPYGIYIDDDVVEEDNTFGVTIDTVSIDADDQTNTQFGIYVSDNTNNAPGVSLVTIKNINISNYNYGLVVLADTSVYLDNIKVYSNPSQVTEGVGIDTGTGSSINTIIKNAEVINYSIGIRVAHGFNNIIENAQIMSYTETTDPFGIDTTASENTSIKSTQISGYQIGIYAPKIKNITITDSIINYNQIGIQADSSTGSVAINRNTIANNTTIGIFLDTSNSQITKNLISANKYGIELDVTSSNNVITNNTITDNTTLGVLLNAGTTGNICTLNVFTGNGGTQFQDSGSNNFTTGAGNNVYNS